MNYPYETGRFVTILIIFLNDKK